MNDPFRIFRPGILLFASILLVACDHHSGPPPKHTYTISGKVTDASAGVNILIEGPVTRSEVTNSTGAYSATGLPPGHYEISPIQEGFLFEPSFAQVDIVDKDVSVPAMARKVPTEGLSPDEMARIDAVPEYQTPAKEIILPNGKNLEEYLLLRHLPLPSLIAGKTAAQVLPDTPPVGPQQRKNQQ